MVNDHEAAAGALADAIWWLKGFAAAQPAEDRTTVQELERALCEARIWLARLARGQTRLLGTYDNAFAVVLTEAELETVWDGLRSGADAIERREAQDRLRPVLDQFTKERREASTRDRGVPF